ncbi:putative allantoinase (plasmid) [Natrialba magadii ATCC 43099]|uniref:Allantoinase n=1 Tax=Natrialba magadii (strain ATCC 43099 / DSM 3394 / CCM 3739 / CIP 104546 / IAM 13178 / JCM 8861 / NBRC 102185 / NCIMB 2190 / MS3) TaxID=547559 RepID=D3T1R1_NATMM|nr:amidohydrolase family protein [Natrialba magadii]ADD07520.1 putative allantoinase [Natrialba magadii ATCC 43099]ELY26556.1 amidohydrolase [Natrialba magadii ATCC 43099]
MTVDTIITGGTIVTPGSEMEASVAIDDGIITAVGAESALPRGETRIDASGLLVLPGVVDPHVHIDEVPANRAGTYETESAAAALGGVTTLIDFAWQGGDRSFEDDEASLLDGIKHKKAKGETSHVDFGLHGVLHRERPETFDELAPAIEAGVTSFKLFMSTYDVGVSNGFIDEAFRHIADLDAVGVLHTEDPTVCEQQESRLRKEGRGDPVDYPDSRPDYTEAMGAAAALRMAEEAGVKYYSVHTSCRKAAEVIEAFRTDGSRVRAETCTHYTALDRSVHEEVGNDAMIAPPLRSQADVAAMFEYLKRGTLSVVSTDHAVYHSSFKDVDQWWNSPYGANSVQRSLPVFHHEAVVERGFSYPFLVRVMCSNPARTFGMPQKGTLEPGTDADIVLFDPNKTQTIRAETNASNASTSIYEGREVAGAVDRTLVRGTVVADGDDVVSDPGHGSFVERELPDWST